MRQIEEKHKENNRELCMLFIDVEKTYDSFVRFSGER